MKTDDCLVCAHPVPCPDHAPRKMLKRKAIQWTVPASFIYMPSQDSMWKPRCWRGEAPATVPAFFLDLSNGGHVYYDRVGTCWGRPIYRQRICEVTTGGA